MSKGKSARKTASKHLLVIDNLLNSIAESMVTKVVVAELVGVEYVTLDKYLRKERNITNEEVVRRMIAVTNLLNRMVIKGKLPIAEEVNSRLKSAVILEEIEKFIKRSK